MIESRFIAAALSGTSTDRNISASSSRETPTTNAITSHRRSCSMSEMSEKNGVQPVTSALAGSAARRSSISSGVRSSVGPKAGSAVMTVSAPSGVVTTGSRPAMRSSARSVATASSAAPAAEVGTTTVRGPFAPGPNSAATRSYAWRVVLPAGWLLASPGQVRRSSTGAASTSRAPRLTSAQTRGIAADAAAQRAVSGSRVRSGRLRRTARGSSLRPPNRHSAGTRVRAAAATNTTAMAVARPNESYVDRPARRRPISETSTVTAANTTDRPDVATARPAA